MGLVMPHAKETGKKKPLSSFIAGAILPKGGVLGTSIYILDALSNIYSAGCLLKVVNTTGVLHKRSIKGKCKFYFYRERI